MRVRANAKINLTLDVCGKRADGYHDVAMIMQETSFCDYLDIELNTTGEISLSCNTADLGNAENTLTYKAAALFFETSGLKCGCNISLIQNIPMCAGLGAGSADAAAVLKFLNSACDNVYSESELCKIGLRLGADVPFCIMGGTALAEGIGEILTPIESSLKKWVAFIKPNINISTPLAYAKMDTCSYPHPDTVSAVKALEAGDVKSFSKAALNCFEFVIAKENPEIEEIKKHLYECGCEFAMMSGSGPTVFGLFQTEADAKRAVSNYPGRFSGGTGEFILKK